MKKIFTFSFLLLFVVSVFAQFETLPPDLPQLKELNPALFVSAKAKAAEMNLPLAIKYNDGRLIALHTIHQGELIYQYIYDPAHPNVDPILLTYEEVVNNYSSDDATYVYANSTPEPPVRESFGEKLLLIPDWTDDRVMAFSEATGDLVNANFIPNSAPHLSSPKEAVITPRNTITVSDQVSDMVHEFNLAGAHLRGFAPVGGVNNAILDNLRGHAYLPNGNLIVCVANGANQNSIPQFDSAGNYIGQFITTSSGGLNSPFGILLRDADILVTASSSNSVHRYNLTGGYLDNLVTGLNFPQQIIELSNGNIAVAVFSTPTTGIRIYSPTGTLVSHFTGVTGNRGVYLLANGNYLTTNGAGVHEINGTTGALVRTVLASANMQYITLYDPDIIPVELLSFTSSVSGRDVELSWITATETNNTGFEIERKGSENWEKIGFAEGSGTSTEMNTYAFRDVSLNAGVYSYRLKQLDFDGTYSYHNLSGEVEIVVPAEFNLSQNYPNPFNPSTKIKYSIPVAGKVSLKLYDMLGNEAAVLDEGYREAGEYRVEFNSGSFNLSSGVYFYKLVAGEFTKTMKLMLLK